MTLHVYSPPLLRMGAYEIGEDGVLARHAMSYEEELRPLGQDGGGEAGTGEAGGGQRAGGEAAG